MGINRVGTEACPPYRAVAAARRKYGDEDEQDCGTHKFVGFKHVKNSNQTMITHAPPTHLG